MSAVQCQAGNIARLRSRNSTNPTILLVLVGANIFTEPNITRNLLYFSEIGVSPASTSKIFLGYYKRKYL
jgi:hypothetical protein